MSVYCSICLKIKDPKDLCQISVGGVVREWECLRKCQRVAAFPEGKKVENVITGISMNDLTIRPPVWQCRDGKVWYTHSVTKEHYYTYSGKLYQTVFGVVDDPRVPLLQLVFGVTFDDLELIEDHVPKDNFIHYIITSTGQRIKCSGDNEWLPYT